MIVDISFEMLSSCQQGRTRASAVSSTVELTFRHILTQILCDALSALTELFRWRRNCLLQATTRLASTETALMGWKTRPPSAIDYRIGTSQVLQERTGTCVALQVQIEMHAVRQ